MRRFVVNKTTSHLHINTGDKPIYCAYTVLGSRQQSSKLDIVFKPLSQYQLMWHKAYFKTSLICLWHCTFVDLIDEHITILFSWWNSAITFWLLFFFQIKWIIHNLLAPVMQFFQIKLITHNLIYNLLAPVLLIVFFLKSNPWPNPPALYRFRIW